MDAELLSNQLSSGCICIGKGLIPNFLLSFQQVVALHGSGDDYISDVWTVSLSTEGPWQPQDLLKQKPRAFNSTLCYISSPTVCLLTEGKLDVTKDGLKLHTLDPEDVFGELALLYSCTQNYSVSGSVSACRCDAETMVLFKRHANKTFRQAETSDRQCVLHLKLNIFQILHDTAASGVFLWDAGGWKHFLL